MKNFILIAQANPNDGGAAAAGGVLGVVIALWIIALLATAFWIWMLVDVLTSDKEPNEKILWALVVILLSLLGAIIYFFVGRKRHSPSMGTSGSSA